MQFRAALVLGSIVMVLSACGGDDAPSVEPGSCGPKPGEFFRDCDEYMIGAGGYCDSQAPADDPECESATCMTERSSCVENALRVAAECTTCWGCLESTARRDCARACEPTFRACVQDAEDSRALTACETARVDCWFACNVYATNHYIGCY